MAPSTMPIRLTDPVAAPAFAAALRDVRSAADLGDRGGGTMLAVARLTVIPAGLGDRRPAGHALRHG